MTSTKFSEFSRRTSGLRKTKRWSKWPVHRLTINRPECTESHCKGKERKKKWKKIISFSVVNIYGHSLLVASPAIHSRNIVCTQSEMEWFQIAVAVEPVGGGVTLSLIYDLTSIGETVRPHKRLNNNNKNKFLCVAEMPLALGCFGKLYACLMLCTVYTLCTRHLSCRCWSFHLTIPNCGSRS